MDSRTISISDHDDQNRYFKLNRDVFVNPNHVVFVPKPNQSTAGIKN